MAPDGGGRSARWRPGRNTPTSPRSEAAPTLIVHCHACRCRCRCHQPPRPDPPSAEMPPQPGEPGWSGYVAALSAKVGSLEGAYALLGHATDRPAA
jgi:hypothetical protein